MGSGMKPLNASPCVFVAIIVAMGGDARSGFDFESLRFRLSELPAGGCGAQQLEAAGSSGIRNGI
jgi:hypothetical protein